MRLKIFFSEFFFAKDLKWFALKMLICSVAMMDASQASSSSAAATTAAKDAKSQADSSLKPKLKTSTVILWDSNFKRFANSTGFPKMLAYEEIYLCQKSDTELIDIEISYSPDPSTSGVMSVRNVSPATTLADIRKVTGIQTLSVATNFWFWETNLHAITSEKITQENQLPKRSYLRIGYLAENLSGQTTCAQMCLVHKLPGCQAKSYRCDVKANAAAEKELVREGALRYEPVMAIASMQEICLLMKKLYGPAPHIPIK